MLELLLSEGGHTSHAPADMTHLSRRLHQLGAATPGAAPAAAAAQVDPRLSLVRSPADSACSVHAQSGATGHREHVAPYGKSPVSMQFPMAASSDCSAILCTMGMLRTLTWLDPINTQSTVRSSNMM
jgi:hypothetical protein